MYQSIYEMALNLGLEPTPGFRKKIVKAHIVLDAEGNYQRIELSADEKKTLCPDKPFQIKGFTGNYSAQFLADHALVVLYATGLSKDKEDKYTAKHENFVKQIRMGSEEGIGILRPIDIFLDRYDSNQELQNRVLGELNSISFQMASDIISFRVGVRNAETDPSCQNYFQRMAGLSNEQNDSLQGYYSAITGKRISPITGTFPMWKGGKAGSGVPIFASSLRGPGDQPKAATKSYGATIDCPMSEEEANIVISGLDYVLNEADQYNPDFGICWWYDTKIKDDVIKKSVLRWQKWVDKKKSSRDSKEEKHERMVEEKRRSEEYKNLLLAAENGQPPKTLKGEYKYHVVSISFPSKGRMLYENEFSDSYDALNQHLLEWYEDSTLTTAYFDSENKIFRYTDSNIVNIYEILYALKLNSKDGGKDGKYSMFHKEKFGLLKAVYTGSQIPEAFFRIATEQYTKYTSFNPEALDKHISEENANCILELEKVFLLRNGGYVMEKELTPENTSIGYQCGRWLAVIDKLQEESLKQSGKKVNRTLSSRFYKQAKKSPAKAFSILNDYIKVYEDRLTDYRSVFEKNFGEISEQIGTYFPERLSVKEQGAFDLGFAQQKQAFYKKSNQANIEMDKKVM